MTTTAYDPGPRIAHAGVINIGTPDLPTSLRFFSGLLGMEVVASDEQTAYLRGYQEHVHHSLVLTATETAQIGAYGFRVRRPEDVELFHEQLLRQEVEVIELAAGTELGRGTAIRFLTPFSEHPFELYYDMERPEAPEELRSKLFGNSSKRRGLGARRLDHFNVQTSPGTVNRAEQWLQNALGFRRREYATMRGTSDTILASWLSVTPQVHDIAIGADFQERTAQFHHVAFNIENFHDVLTAADRMRDLDIQIDAGPGKHGVGQAMYLYVRDPGSGHRIELYSGGYMAFDPDWEVLHWEPQDMRYGMTWYGDLPNVAPDSPYLQTTPSAGLARP